MYIYIVCFSLYMKIIYKTSINKHSRTSFFFIKLTLILNQLCEWLESSQINYKGLIKFPLMHIIE